MWCALLLLALVISAQAQSAQAQSLRVMSFNVRYPAKGDGANIWDSRRDLLVETIQKAAPDIMGAQELFYEQAQYIVEKAPELAWFGVSRRGNREDEHMGVFYRKAALELRSSGNFWLSETPEEPGSMSWDVSLPRMVTWGEFKDRRTNRTFFFYNTHFAHRQNDGEARKKSAEVIAKHLAKLPKDADVVLTGDFNTDAGTEPHRILTALLQDAREHAAEQKGPVGTFHGFTGKPGQGRIDWILYCGKLRPVSVEAVAHNVENRYPSDHFPVLAVFDWTSAPARSDEEAVQLRALIAASRRLPMPSSALAIDPGEASWTTDYITSVAVSRDGLYHVLHRNLTIDPVLVVNDKGQIVRSWGKGLFTNPHSIRIDDDGNVWTVDSGSSQVRKFTSRGKELLRIEIGEVPQTRSGFRGATDIAFGPAGRLFIADGYGNARILEYDQKGQRVRVWGKPGSGPGEFNLPHSLAVLESVIYVADRENGRIQKFDLEGKYLGEWKHLGKTFSIRAARDGSLWVGTHPRNVANEAAGWLVNIARDSGNILGYVESPGLHSLDPAPDGNVISDPGRGNQNQVLRFRQAR